MERHRKSCRDKHIRVDQQLIGILKITKKKWERRSLTSPHSLNTSYMNVPYGIKDNMDDL